MRRSAILRLVLAALAATIFTGCSEPDRVENSSGHGWPNDLVPPIQGASFSLRAGDLPGAPRDRGAGIQQGFDFFPSLTGQVFAPDLPVVAVAAGEIVRVDSDYSEAGPDRLEYWASFADESGKAADYALDRLRGRQVWIRHADGHLSRYAHLSQVSPELSPGDRVEKGEPIGVIGVSGVPATDEQSEPEPRLHYELWNPEGDRHLGQGLAPLDIHRNVALVFGKASLPRYAQRVLSEVDNGQAAPENYPPTRLPETGFSVNPPPQVPFGSGFAIPVTWKDEDYSAVDIFGYMEGAPLGVINAGNGAWLLGSVPPDSSADEVRISIGGVDLYGQTASGEGVIEIASRNATPLPVEVSVALLERYSEANRLLEARRISRASQLSMQSVEAKWDSAFQPPLGGRVVGGFGQALVAGPTAPAFPRPGVLIEAAGDAIVNATNDGIVALAGELPIRGKTVVIVHGGGVISVYAHLSSVRVAPGQTVAKGEALGEIGQTGAIDTPLLRWEIHVAGIPSNPQSWLDSVLPGR